jgi:3-oxoacyl-[acyl-carrier protein] reductase
MKMKIGKDYYLSRNGLHPVVSSFRNTPENYFEGKGSSLRNKVALVTGGYKGIGLSIVKTFLREGAKVIFTGRNKMDLQETYKMLDTKDAAFMEWDVSDIRKCPLLMQSAFDVFGTIDILLNNAGVYRINGRQESFEGMTEEYFIKMNCVNFIGPRNMCENYIDLVKDRKGKIINILSICALMAPGRMNKYEWTYYISKRAFLAYTKALSARISNNIMVNAIAPGPIKTSMSWKPGQSIVETRSPNARIGLPEEVAELALMLAGETGDAISGQVYCCDGGYVLK